ncbi:MAG: GNAT family N-acetyltransferase, partial [Dehalococcoidia bacterium]|nr:GNAT family N-acetyltransferase [Dehalococcoidia bacterium]
MPSDIRPIQPDEFEAYVGTQSAAFSFDIDPRVLEQERQVFEFDRSLAAFDGPEIAGTTGIYSFDLAVPGGSLPTAGVTAVAVRPTHRRRGVLSALMRRQLDDVRERGEPLAALWASESVIYGRFGYGLAAEAVEIEIDRARTELTHESPACGRMRLISRDDALELWPAIYHRVLRTQPGMYSRSAAWWEHKSLRAVDPYRGRSSSDFFVTYEEDEPLGYVRYRVRSGHTSGLPDGIVLVQELMAATDAAYTALWRYVFGIDLMGKIQAGLRRPDEPLFWMLADPRRLIRRPFDALWLRLIDIPAALEGREYAAQGRLVLDVRDAFCPWNQGRYKLEAGPEGAR